MCKNLFLFNLNSKSQPSKWACALLRLIFLVFTLTVLTVSIPQAQAQVSGGEEYIVQAGDWLTKIANKYYGNSQDFALIFEATNVKAAKDNSYATLTDPNFIEVGQKLWVPTKQGADILTAGDLSFQAVSIEELGIDTVVPVVWPAVESTDPFLEHAWRAGPFSSVSFTTTPGTDSQLGLSRLLGVTQQDLSGEVIGGELSEEQFGERTWTLFTRDDGGVASVVAATVHDKVIYQLSLFAGSSQKDTILSTILANFEITDPAAAQQQIAIVLPAPGSELTDPFELRGTTSQYPFRGNLIYRVLDAGGNQVGRSAFEVVGVVGDPSTFAVSASYQVAAGGPGTVEIAEVSAADGTIIAIDSVGVMLLADPPGYVITIDDPAPYASVSNPLQIRGQIENRPVSGTLNYRLVDAARRQISSGFLQVTGGIDQVNLFDGFAEFEALQNGPGRVEVFDVKEDGSILAISTMNVWLTTP